MSLTRDANIGKHRFLTMQPTTDPITSATQIALYNKVISTVPQLFFRPSSNQTPIQLTFSSLLTGLQSTNPDVYFATQYSFIAGPFVIYGGLIKTPTDGQVVVLTPTTTLIHVGLLITHATNINQVIAVPINILGSSFTISTKAPFPPFDIYYFAVGV